MLVGRSQLARVEGRLGGGDFRGGQRLDFIDARFDHGIVGKLGGQITNRSST
jgi:hypothetical protein